MSAGGGEGTDQRDELATFYISFQLPCVRVAASCRRSIIGIAQIDVSLEVIAFAEVLRPSQSFQFRLKPRIRLRH